MNQLTDLEQKQVELGLSAEKLMQDPFFVYLMSEMGNAYVDALVRTAPTQTNEREALYHGIKALQDINATLAQWLQVKEANLARLEAQDDNEESEYE